MKSFLVVISFNIFFLNRLSSTLVYQLSARLADNWVGILKEKMLSHFDQLIKPKDDEPITTLRNDPPL